MTCNGRSVVVWIRRVVGCHTKDCYPLPTIRTRDKQHLRCGATPLSPSFPNAEDVVRGPRPRVSPHLAHQPILPQWLSKIACPLPPLLSYLMPVHHPRPASAFLSPVTVCVCVCVCAVRVSIPRVRLRGAPLPIPQARTARACFPSCLPAPLRVARTKQDPDTCARTRGELGGGGGGCKEEEMSHREELGHGTWPSGWRRSLLNGVRRRRR